MNVGDEVVYVGNKHLTCGCRNRATVGRLGKKGTVHTVSAIVERCRCEAGPSVKLVGVENTSPNRGWCRDCFRKVDKREACEAEFLTLIKLAKRKVSA